MGEMGRWWWLEVRRDGGWKLGEMGRWWLEGGRDGGRWWLEGGRDGEVVEGRRDGEVVEEWGLIDVTVKNMPILFHQAFELLI